MAKLLLDGEEWRLVNGTDDYYISNKGRFRRGNKLLKTTCGKDGYPRINVNRQKKRLHRVVAEAFIPNPDNLPVVDHIDGDKTNACVENLRWVTQQENVQAAYDNGLFKDASKHRKKAVGVITPEDDVFIYDTLVEAAEFVKTTPDVISRCFRGIEKQVNGHRFIRVNELHDYRVKKG